MFLENNYVHKDTLVHRINPLIKFIAFLSIVFLLFLPITTLAQISLIILVIFVIWKSDCKDLIKKIPPLYFLLVLFLFMVNFFFMKTPGFWFTTEVNNYKDILGLVRDSGQGEKVQHGWYFGGEILKKTDGNIWFGETVSNISSSTSNYSSRTNWNYIPVKAGDTYKYVGFSPSWYMISALQIVKAISLANKIVLIIILSSIFTITISLSSFTYALEDLFRPLKIFKLPTEVMALVIAIAIRFVPSLIGEAFRIIRAQAARGIDYKNGNFRDKASALLSLFVPLFVISFIKSGELSAAMIARGYDHHHSRTSFKIHIVSLWELLLFFGFMSFISMNYYMFWNGYYFGLISNLEYLVFLAR